VGAVELVVTEIHILQKILVVEEVLKHLYFLSQV
jgi:hypothetical protein